MEKRDPAHQARSTAQIRLLEDPNVVLTQIFQMSPNCLDTGPAHHICSSCCSYDKVSNSILLQP